MWKHWISVGASSVAGGAGAWATQHIALGAQALSSLQAAEGFALGMLGAGVIALGHLLQGVKLGASLAAPSAPQAPAGKGPRP